MTDETADKGQDSISILFLPILQETISLFTKSFVSHEANENSSEREPRAVVSVTQMAK